MEEQKCMNDDIEQVWDKGEVVKDWKDAEIVPIPKESNT